MFAGGYAGTEGIIHSGIGPFDMNRGVGLGYATMRYTRNALRFSVFSNILNGDATALLSFGPDGQQIPFSFKTRTYDVEVGNVSLLGPTESYTQVNGAFGVRWMGDRLTTTVKVLNLGTRTSSRTCSATSSSGR